MTTDATEAGHPWTLMNRSGNSALLLAQLIAESSHRRGRWFDTSIAHSQFRKSEAASRVTEVAFLLSYTSDVQEWPAAGDD
ncbi:hypothetical protein [Micromonospora saelicesensis]|uniref:hypothetical protein n=1 Tax=Micromonospora saelicesensis TaxID=285676 RepID=UPI00114CABA1|nr:hypothetical protein [Micromonospora saelicesensis]